MREKSITGWVLIGVAIVVVSLVLWNCSPKVSRYRIINEWNQHSEQFQLAAFELADIPYQGKYEVINEHLVLYGQTEFPLSDYPVTDFILTELKYKSVVVTTDYVKFIKESSIGYSRGVLYWKANHDFILSTETHFIDKWEQLAEDWFYYQDR